MSIRVMLVLILMFMRCWCGRKQVRMCVCFQGRSPYQISLDCIRLCEHAKPKIYHHRLQCSLPQQSMYQRLRRSVITRMLRTMMQYCASTDTSCKGDRQHPQRDMYDIGHESTAANIRQHHTCASRYHAQQTGHHVSRGDDSNYLFCQTRFLT
jgi:hypothetical protein